MKILLIEPDAELSALLTNVLQTYHYGVDRANSGEIGLNLATETDYDLILLAVDVTAADLSRLEDSGFDGLSLCRHLRSQGYRKPILLLTAENSDAVAIAGLDAGADDYIHKQSSPEVLLARMRTWLRRRGARDPALAASASAKTVPHASSKLTWGKLCLDPEAARVTFAGKTITLTATEYNLLELFLRNPDRIFSRSAILDRLWGADAAPTDRAIVTHVKDVRKKLRAGGLTTDLIETVYGMGYRLKPVPHSPGTHPAESSPASDLPQSPAGITGAATGQNRCPPSATLLKRFRDIVNSQVAVLETARTAYLDQTLDLELQQAAHLEAHKLAGSLASFGYPEGSKLARSIEHLLLSESLLPSAVMSQVGELVTALQAELSHPPVTTPTATVAGGQTYRVLVIDDNLALTEQLTAAADAWGFRIKVAPNPTAARSRLAVSIPDVVLLDLSFPEAAEDGFLLLREMQQRSPDLPVIVFSGRDSLADRLAVSRLGARQFLHKPATTEQIFQAIARVVSPPHVSEAKVLIVDDDSAMLGLLSTMLKPWGLEVTMLSQPQHFWKVLVATAPNLILLDLEMPQVNGLELCRIVRLDAQWGDLPILVVTAHTDAESLQRAFAAGADDFITKPILGPELISRVLSRIERNRLRQS